MNAGIVNSLFNQLYFRDSLSTWCALRHHGCTGVRQSAAQLLLIC